MVKGIFPESNVARAIILYGWLANLVMIFLMVIMYAPTDITTEPIVELRLLGVVFYPIGFFFGIMDTEIFIKFLIGN